MAIELKDLATGYHSKGNDKVVSKDLNAVVHSGELTCLIGPNGAGKSTLLRTIAGFQPAISGDVLLDGQSVSSYESNELAKNISIVLTDNSNIQNLTAYEVVAMGRTPYTGFWGRLKSADKSIVQNCLQLVGIENIAQQAIQTLSDGERQKTMIAKAIAQETPNILLDEPTAFLYYPNKVAIMMLLRRLAHEMGKAVLLSIHDIDLALQVADKILFMQKDGSIICGTPEQLCENGTIEQQITGSDIEFDRTNMAFKVKKVYNNK